MTVEELIVMLREYSERGSEEDFADAAGFLEALQYGNKEYRKQMTDQAARIKRLEAMVSYLAGTNECHVRVMLTGNPIVCDEIISKARAALGATDE